MSEVLRLLPGYLAAHLQLSLLALGIGTAASVPLGLWITRRPRLAQAVLGAAAVVQTVPSLALLALMVPLLAALGALAGPLLGVEIPSIGLLPALIALTLYGLLPVLQNTVAGIAGIDPALREAARAVGMTHRQRLLQVEIPLALPVIVAGLRTSAVWVVGTATLSTPVGATSLGNFIFSGLQTRNATSVVTGCVAAAALALALDQAIRILERGLRERRRGLWAGATAALLALVGVTGLGALASWGDSGAREIRIGSKTFTEQYILSELLAAHVQRETGLRAQALQSLGSTVLFDALRAGEIDLYVDYSGTIWATIMRQEGLPGTRAEVLAEVSAFLAREHGIEVAAALGFENTYALAMRADRARDLGIDTLSDLARASPALEIGGDYEFFSRAEWKALRRVYGFEFARQRSMDPALMYQAAAQGAVDVISAFSTDGRIGALGLRTLRDDRGVVPPYDAIVLAGPSLAARQPRVLAALRRLEGVLDERTMQALNRAVDHDGQAPAAVARAFLAARASGAKRRAQ